MSDVLVVGAGAVGLLVARELLGSGVKVSLLERQSPCREASWAGGGIVSPLYPWRYKPAVTALALWSQDFYPQLADQLHAQTGIDPEVTRTGLYWLDLPNEERALAWAQLHGREMHCVSADAVRQQVPALGRSYQRALWMPSVANVRNPRLGKALQAALAADASFTLQEQCPIQRLEVQGGKFRGVHTAQGFIAADTVVLCAGAWTAELLKPLGLTLPVEPVKGQMLLYKKPAGWLKSMVLADGRYAIPRRDGHIVFGSTLEYEGFDKTPTAEANQSLQASVAELLPELAQEQPVAHWAGLRPSSPDGVPFIGPVPGVEGLWLNCGHFRNGLVMAPASCRLLADLLLGREPIVDPAPYDPRTRLLAL
nr:glycine oxidase ThiO [Atopomonas sediminilitoris]